MDYQAGVSAAEDEHHMATWRLPVTRAELIAGFTMVAASDWLARVFVRPSFISSSSTAWDSDALNAGAHIIQVLGVMLFVLGLVERVVLSMEWARVRSR